MEELTSYRKITLKIARVQKKLTLEEVSKTSGIDIEKLREFESDCSEMPISIALILGKLYDISFENIFIGLESDFYLE